MMCPEFFFFGKLGACNAFCKLFTFCVCGASGDSAFALLVISTSKWVMSVFLLTHSNPQLAVVLQWCLRRDLHCHALGLYCLVRSGNYLDKIVFV